MTDEWRTSANDGEPPPHVVDLNGQRHGLAIVCYRKHEGEIWPTLECTCGSWWAAPTWQDAGSSFDDHLEDVQDGPA